MKMMNRIGNHLVGILVILKNLYSDYPEVVRELEALLETYQPKKKQGIRG